MLPRNCLYCKTNLWENLTSLAVAAMTLPMARDLGVFGIRVLTVCPGIFDTPLMAAASDPVKQGLAVSVIAPKRLGRPQEFGLLVSQMIENSYMNGEVIRLDGGIRVRIFLFLDNILSL